ncbi:hypothetical protein SRABI106_04087 [Rahnella aquatilis]|nr:hypothetical protein SRABI106_04087 [Rahnella aquatilis]
MQNVNFTLQDSRRIAKKYRLLTGFTQRQARAFELLQDAKDERARRFAAPVIRPFTGELHFRLAHGQSLSTGG